MTTNNYDFPVELVPVVTQSSGILIPRKFAVIRPDTGQPMGIVSNRYGLIHHETVINGLRNALSNKEYQEHIQVTNNGAFLFATYKFLGMTEEVSKGDKVSFQFIIKNSYDGTNSLQIIFGAFRLVCSNGMVIGKELLSYSQTHRGLESSLKTTVFTDKINTLISEFNNITIPILQKMSRHKLNKPTTELFTYKSIKKSKGRNRLPNYLLDEARIKYEKEKHKTVWNFYNSLTFAITHSLKTKNPQMFINYSKIAWEIANKQL